VCGRRRNPVCHEAFWIDIRIVDELENYMITETLSYVNNALNEKGYNGISQIVGYLMSGDLGYISSYKEARNKISKIDRSALLEVVLKKYLNK